MPKPSLYLMFTSRLRLLAPVGELKCSPELSKLNRQHFALVVDVE